MASLPVMNLFQGVFLPLTQSFPMSFGGKSLRRTKCHSSDTLTQHQSDQRHRSNLIPMRGQNDDTNRVDLAARTAWVDVTGAVYDLAKIGSVGLTEAVLRASLNKWM